MPRSIWRGTISFGLVTIPVSVMPAVATNDIAFHLLDSRDLSPIHTKRVNEAGEEVAWELIVKGREVGDGRWITVTDDEIKAANVAATQTIDVLGAVCADEVPLSYFDTPYHLTPDKPGIKAYALLREALRASGRIAIAQVVIRSRQHLCALVPQGDLLVLELLRYPRDLRAADDLAVPGSDLEALGITEAELELANQLVATIQGPWAPETYRDTFREEVLALIERKAAGEAVTPTAPQPPAAVAPVIDIAELLKRSVEEARRAKTAGEAS
ncbi:MAG: Ku protein [Coriobacteriia bacterium]|nr:Ku protein [Coriobacteriia bacterium]